MARLFVLTRLLLGLIVVALAALLQTLILLVLLPSRKARILSCIVFMRLTGAACLWLSGCRLTLTGREHLNGRRPAIYVLNHTSILDLFIVLRYFPSSAVGVAKKEIVKYPFFGQMYLLTGHLRMDRGHQAAAHASLRELSDLVRTKKLSIALAPEGTRARDGRLQPFKKGMVHLALQTGLPVVPVVIRGANRVWRSDTLSLHSETVQVDVFPPVDTAHWTAEDSGGALDEIHAIYRDALPADQLPLTDDQPRREAP